MTDKDIELVDEPRTEKSGDNKPILSSLKNGPIRDEIDRRGGIKLIYIDPPFDVGADFSMDIEIGDEAFTEKPNVLEELAWQSFHTKSNRSLEPKTPFHECNKGQYKIAVKVVDISGNDTMKIIKVTV